MYYTFQKKSVPNDPNQLDHTSQLNYLEIYMLDTYNLFLCTMPLAIALRRHMLRIALLMVVLPDLCTCTLDLERYGTCYNPLMDYCTFYCRQLAVRLGLSEIPDY